MQVDIKRDQISVDCFHVNAASLGEGFRCEVKWIVIEKQPYFPDSFCLSKSVFHDASYLKVGEVTIP
jgi:hypothetical protein